MVQPFMGWVGYEGIDISWDVSPVSSPIIVLSHRSEFNKEETRGAREDDAHPNFCRLKHFTFPWT